MIGLDYILGQRPKENSNEDSEGDSIGFIYYNGLCYMRLAHVL